MASTLALAPVIAAIRTLLRADGTLAAMLATVTTALGGGAAVYGEGTVPELAAFPYLTVGAGTELPFNTMGAPSASHWGSNCTIQIKALSTKPGDDEVAAILGRAKTLLDGQTLTVAGYGSVAVQFESAFPVYGETVGGVVVRQFPMFVRVWVHQAA